MYSLVSKKALLLINLICVFKIGSQNVITYQQIAKSGNEILDGLLKDNPAKMLTD